MEHLDRETMESLGYFFLTIGMVPSSWASRRPRCSDVDSDQYRGPIVVWWTDDQPAIDVSTFCDARWSREVPTGWYLRDDVHETSWSDENNHRVEIVEDDLGHIVDFTVLIDIQMPYSDFVDQLIDMAMAADCVLFDYEQVTTNDPSRVWILKKVQEHEMSHVVFDSSGKLAPN